MEPIVRKFNVAVAILIEFTGKVLDYLTEDLTLFTDYDPDLNSDKKLQLKTLYDSAHTCGTDEVETGKVTKLTENLTEELKHCKSIITDVHYFAKKKFGKSPAILKQFGFNNYRKATNNQPKMVLYMNEIAATVEKYKTELIAAGLKETVIASIKPAATAYEKCNIDQETGKGYRTLSTEERTVLHNSIYDILSDFSDAAKIIFAGNALKRKRYVLPHNNKKGGGGNKGPKPGL